MTASSIIHRTEEYFWQVTSRECGAAGMNPRGENERSQCKWPDLLCCLLHVCYYRGHKTRYTPLQYICHSTSAQRTDLDRGLIITVCKYYLFDMQWGRELDDTFDNPTKSTPLTELFSQQAPASSSPVFLFVFLFFKEDGHYCFKFAIKNTLNMPCVTFSVHAKHAWEETVQNNLFEMM